jgi:hypothetical protein
MRRLILLSCLVVGSLLLAPSAGASGDFYCSANVLMGGQGTTAEPWACVTVDQFNARVAEVCRAGGGTLYFLFEGGYVDYTVNPDCSVVSGTPNPGTPGPTTPPSAGADLPLPWLVTIAVLAAGSLVVAGVVLRRGPAAGT